MFIKHCLLIVLGFLMLSCDGLKTSIQLDEELTDGIYIRIHQVFDDNGIDVIEGQLMLEMISEKIFPCYNYRIDTQKRSLSDHHLLHVRGVNFLDICLTAFGPARKNERFTLHGDFSDRIIFVHNSNRHELTLNLMNDRILASGSDTNWLRIADAVNFKRPYGVFRVRFRDLDNPIVQQFFKLLHDHFNASEYSFPDNGLTPFDFWHPHTEIYTSDYFEHYRLGDSFTYHELIEQAELFAVNFSKDELLEAGLTILVSRNYSLPFWALVD